VLLVICTKTALCGCHVGWQDRLLLTTLYDRGDYDAAAQRIEELRLESDAELQILAVEDAVIQLMAGKPSDAMRQLETVRRELDYLSQQELTEQVQAALKDDNAIAWSGREYERRMVDNLQLVAALVNQDDDAFAMSTRVLQAIHTEDRSRHAATKGEVSDVGRSDESNGGKGLQRPAEHDGDLLSTWLAAAVHSERIQDADLTDRLIQQVAEWSTTGTDQSGAVQLLGTRSHKGMGTLQDVTLVGRVTGWESERVVPTTAALLVADRILSAVGDHTLPATVSPVRIARPITRAASSPFRTRVTVGRENSRSATSDTLVDLNRTAWASYQHDRDQQIARAVVRRIVKKSSIYTLKDSLDVERESGADVLMNLAGGLWEALEKADLRHCRLLPASVEIAQMELPVGEHQIRLQVVTNNAGPDSRPLDELQVPITINDARNTFVVCFRPQSRLVAVQSQ